MTLRAPVEGESLRQGDICFIKGLPLWNLSASSTQADPQGVLTHFVIPPHKALQWDELTGSVAVAICSHDCDVENPRSRTGIIVAPLIKVPASIGSTAYNQIMASGDVSERIDYVNLFPLLLAGGGEERAAVVDLSALVTVAKADVGVELLAANRKYVMEDTARDAFRTKLALFFARPYQDPREAADSA
ncbi:hypothetical protein [Microbacterium aureliae]